MSNMNKGIWTFTAAAACLDICFAYQCRDSMLQWESNPLARWAFQSHGLAGVILVRAALLGFAIAMSATNTRFSWLVAPAWGLGHVYLLLTLLVAGPSFKVLRTQPSHELSLGAALVRSDGAPSTGSRTKEGAPKATFRSALPQASAQLEEPGHPGSATTSGGEFGYGASNFRTLAAAN